VVKTGFSPLKRAGFARQVEGMVDGGRQWDCPSCGGLTVVDILLLQVSRGWNSRRFDV
jgi:hypothetical protein